MRVQINTDSSIEGTEDLAETVTSTVHAALDRYGDRLTRVEAHLSNEDGTTGEGRRGMRCLLEARPSGLDPVVVAGTGDTVERAAHDATQKMQSLLDSTFGRIDSRDANETIRWRRR
jgi:hypothetical protein